MNRQVLEPIQVVDWYGVASDSDREIKRSANEHDGPAGYVFVGEYICVIKGTIALPIL